MKIFPVDGQHRVAGIKKAIEDKPEMKSERVPVILLDIPQMKLECNVPEECLAH